MRKGDHMIAQIEITGVGAYSPDESAKSYIKKKIGKLDRLVPRHARKTIHAEVKVAEVNRDHGNKYEAEVILTVPDRQITAKDSTMNVLAAIDIVEAKLATQLRKYKEDTVTHIGKRKLLARFKRSYAREL
jgi:putative sigma-54 modulation protein